MFRSLQPFLSIVPSVPTIPETLTSPEMLQSDLECCDNLIRFPKIDEHSVVRTTWGKSDLPKVVLRAGREIVLSRPESVFDKNRNLDYEASPTGGAAFAAILLETRVLPNQIGSSYLFVQAFNSMIHWLICSRFSCVRS